MTKPQSDRKAAELSAENLASSAARAARGGRGPAPVHLWDPPYCGALDIRIARDGTWYYLGPPIGRKELVRLFSTILRRDGEKYFLVTPVEKVGITVDDAPFVAVEFEVDEARSAIQITATVKTMARTGVEMEALPAVTVAALTIYDMAKASDRAMRIEKVRLVRKRGGRSGDINLE